MRYLRPCSHIFLIPFFLLSEIYAQDPDTIPADRKYKIKVAGYPAAGYTPETSIQLGAVGVLLFERQAGDSSLYYRPATINPYFLITFKGQFLSSVKSDLYFRNQQYLNINLRYFNYPDLYFGIGRNNPGISESYTDEFFKIDGRYAQIIRRNFFPGIAFEYSFDHLGSIQEGGGLDTGMVNGIQGGHCLGFGPVFRYDTRNNILYPDQGIYFESAWLFFPGDIVNDYSFNSFLLDFRYFTAVFGKDNILALQFIFQSAYGNSVPFYKLPRLGGDSRLRGVEHENRYRDRNAYYLQVEGRKHLFWRLGGVLFAGAGNVSSHFGDSPFERMKYVLGLGGRFQPFKSQKLNLRLDIGKGPDAQYGIYLSVREAF